ncbi:hypothetical protein JCM8097_003283 [Rhodosporidiobolus ruineniae]
MSPLHHHHASSGSTVKGQHYQHTLDLARRLGLTTSQYPAQGKPASVNRSALAAQPGLTAAGGAGERGVTSGAAATAGHQAVQGQMDWTELLRKYTKHNPTRTLTAQSTLLEHTLRTLLVKSHRAASSASPSSSPATKSIADLLTAPPAFDLPPSPHGIAATHLSEAKTALEALEAVVLSSSSAASKAEVNSAKIVLAWARYVVGEPEAALRALKECELEVPGEDEAVEGYDVVLKVVGAAVEAFSLTLLTSTPSSPSNLLPAYQRAASLYAHAADHLARRDPESSKDDVELHRVGGEVTYRAAMLARQAVEAEGSSPSAEALSSALSLHALYLSRSASFSRPTAFPPAHRAPLHRSLRSLLSAPSLPPAPPALYASWERLASANDRAEERLVRESTTVPKAGETNRAYLRFLEEVVQGWVVSGAPEGRAAEVVEILYNALSHTIQSQLLLRLLVHVLALSPSSLSPSQRSSPRSSTPRQETIKVLRLYRQYGEKSRETDARRVAGEMRRLRLKAERGELDPEEKGEEKEKGGEEDEEEKERRERAEDEKLDLDLDPTPLFVDTLLFGVRLLLHPSSSAALSVEEAKEALEVAQYAREALEQARERGEEGTRGEEGERVEGMVEWALGVAEGAMARVEANPSTRPSLHTSSLAHLARAVSLTPHSFAAHFSHAAALLELRQVSSAIASAKRAVELAPPVQGGAGAGAEGRARRARAWHLLALAVSAGKDYHGAVEVVETALDELDPSDDETAASSPAVGGDSSEERERARELRWTTPSSPAEVLALHTQLRLTKAALVEYLDGAAAGLGELQGVLGFFSREVGALGAAEEEEREVREEKPLTAAAAKGPQALGGDGREPKPHRATSILGRRRSSKKAASSVTGAPEGPAPASSASPIPSTVNSSAANLSLAPTSASTVSPSSPAAASPPSSPLRPILSSHPSLRLLLAQIWLACAATFRRLGRAEEAKGAVGEAEGLVGWTEGREERDVSAALWSQLAQIHLVPFPSSSSSAVAPSLEALTAARETLQKALTFAPAHLPSLVLLARTYLYPPPPSPTTATATEGAPVGAAPPPPPSHLTSPVPPPALSSSPSQADAAHRALHVPLAESILDTLTRHRGWDSPEAWFELARCCALSPGGGGAERRRREREALVWGLQLEETRAVRGVGGAGVGWVA